MIEITKEERNILFHTLGLNYKAISFRNHFVASKNHSDYKTLESLRERGFMKLGESPSFCPDTDLLYHVTDNGKKVAYAEKKKLTPKLTRSQRRYRMYLQSESDEGFFNWLKNKYWDSYRKEAGC